jgi:hypothetical protein
MLELTPKEGKAHEEDMMVLAAPQVQCIYMPSRGMSIARLLHEANNIRIMYLVDVV